MFYKFSRQILALVLISILIMPEIALAETAVGASLSSDSFRIIDSQHSVFGGVASSSSQTFILIGTIGDLAIGSASADSFGLRSGFLYYPKVIAPTLATATAGNGQVDLSWTAAQAFQGWSISGYNVCTKPSGGSYTCENAGDVTITNFSKTSLTNGTAYTFKIEAKDGTGNVISESNEKGATPAAPATPTPTPPPSGGGGGGGGGASIVDTGTIIIKGIAYPNSTVNVFRDGNLVTSIRAGSNAKFEVRLDSVPVGQRLIGLNSEDANGRKSITVNFSVVVTAGITITLTDVFLPPTIDISASAVNKGEILRIFGQAAPISEVNIHVQSEEQKVKVISDNLGAYAVRFDTKVLEEDEHTTKSRFVIESLVSPFSKILQFIVGRITARYKTADLNKDGRVNIIDFSILLFWWNTKVAKGLDIADINDDGKVNVIDFSIMLFQWTG